MTATQNDPKHAAPSARQTHRAARKVAPVLPLRPESTTTKAKTATAKATKADFSVDSKGTVSKVTTTTLGGVASAAAITSGAIATAYPRNWLLEMMENETQRRQRVNAQAVAQVLGLLALGAAKLAKRRSK